MISPGVRERSLMRVAQETRMNELFLLTVKDNTLIIPFLYIGSRPEIRLTRQDHDVLRIFLSICWSWSHHTGLHYFRLVSLTLGTAHSDQAISPTVKIQTTNIQTILSSFKFVIYVVIDRFSQNKTF